MTPTLVAWLLVVAVLSASVIALPQRASPRNNAEEKPLTLLCQHPACSCNQTEDGLEEVSCDCGNLSAQQPLVLGDVSAFVSQLTVSLQVRRCHNVTIQPQALAGAASLTQMSLVEIEHLRLHPMSLFNALNRLQDVYIGHISNLTIDPKALDQVIFLRELALDDVHIATLPTDIFGKRTDIQNITIANSQINIMEDRSLAPMKADDINIIKSNVGVLKIEANDVLRTNIVDSIIDEMDTVRLNMGPNFHNKIMNTVNITGNNITSMNTEGVEVTADLFSFTNNTVESLTGPLRVNYKSARVVGNNIDVLGDEVFREFVQLPALDPRNIDEDTQDDGQRYSFTFAGNSMHMPENGSFGLFLHADEQLTENIYRVFGNTFTCTCETMQRLVEAGDREFVASAASNQTDQQRSENMADDQQEDDGVTLDELYLTLYTTSRCVGGSVPLTQYRLTAYTDQYTCKEPNSTKRTSGASNIATGSSLAITLLLAVTAAAGLTP